LAWAEAVGVATDEEAAAVIVVADAIEDKQKNIRNLEGFGCFF